MNRTHTTLAGLLVVQVALILLVRSPFSGASSGVESRPLLPMLEALTPLQLELLGDEERRVTLVKGNEGWTLQELGGFPADDKKIDDLIDDLRALTVRRPVVTSKRYHATFKVEAGENEGRVRLWDDPSEDPAVDLIVGSSPNYRAVHVRLQGDSRVYEVRNLAAYDVRADEGAWIKKDLVDIPETELIGLSIDNANGGFELVKQEDGWHATGSELALDPDKVETFIRAASSIQLAQPVGPKDAEAHGFGQAAATLTLRFRAAGEAEPAEVRETVVAIGSKLPDNESQRHISRSDFAFTGAIWESSVKALLERKLDDLLPDDDDADAAG